MNLRQRVAETLLTWAVRTGGEGLRDSVSKIVQLPRTTRLGATGVSGEPQAVVQSDPARVLEVLDSWAWKCVSVISENLAQILRNAELYLDPGTSDRSKWQRFENHPGLDLLRNPNPFFNGHELVVKHFSSLLAFGNCVWHLPTIGRGAEPSEIHILPWQNISPVYDPEGRRGIVTWDLSTQGGRVPIPADQTLHWREPSPDGSLIGRAPILAAARPIDIARLASLNNLARFQNGSRIGGVIRSKSKLPKDQIDALYERMRLEHGGVGRAHLDMVLDSGLEYDPPPTSAIDMDYSKAIEMARSEILEIFGVPSAVIGRATDFNRANMEAAMFAFQKFTLEPRAECFTSGLAENFFTRWSPGRGQWRCVPPPFVAKDADRERADMLARLGQGTGRPIATIDEERERRGEKPIGHELTKTILIGSGVFGLDEDRTPAAPFGASPFATGGPSEKPEKPPADGNEPAEDDEEQREKKGHVVRKSYLHWKRFVQAHSVHEKRLLAAYRPEFKAQQEMVEKRARRLLPKAAGLVEGWGREKAFNYLLTRKDITEELFPDPRAETVRIAKATAPVKVAAINESAASFFRGLGISVPKDARPIPHIDDERVGEFVDQLAFKNLQHVNETTRDRLRSEFAKVIAERGGIVDIADAIKSIDAVYGDLYDGHRGMTIARTEMTGAWNWAQLEAANEANETLDVGVKKTWIAAHDERTRQWHLDAGDEYAEGIPLDVPFVVRGEALDYPGDPAGSGPNLIWCRCALGYVTV